MSTAQWEKRITPKKREREKEERMGLLSRQQAPGLASPPQTQSKKERKRRREDKLVSSPLKREWPALLITLTLRNQEKPIYLKTKAFNTENETILEYFCH